VGAWKSIQTDSATPLRRPNTNLRFNSSGVIVLVDSAPLKEFLVLTVTDPLLGVLSDFCRIRSDRAARRDVVGVSGTSEAEVRLFVGVLGRGTKAGAGIGGSLSNADVAEVGGF